MIYVLSDIHGREDRFNSILKQIHLKKTDHLYILGDVIDRNPDGIRLLRRIARAENMTMLLGNHEYMMLDVLDHSDDDEKRILWYNNGGGITWQKWKYCSRAFQNEMSAFLHALPTGVEISCGGKEWLLVHAAPEKMYDSQCQRKYHNSRMFAVWYRLTKHEEVPGDRIVVFGHTPTNRYNWSNPMTVFLGDQRIGIDCGCAYPEGRLACIRLDDGTVFYSSIIQP